MCLEGDQQRVHEDHTAELLVAWLVLFAICTVFYVSDYLSDYRNRMVQKNCFLWAYCCAEFVCECFCKPLTVIKVVKKLQNGLIPVKMKDYFKTICMCSDYPDQIRFNPNTRGFTLESGPLAIALTCPSKSEFFELQNVTHLVMQRFIEILPSITLNYFSKTSKLHYYQSLDIRGIEYSHFFYYQVPPEELSMVYIGDVSNFNTSKNGRLVGSSDQFLRRPEMTSFVMCRDNFVADSSDLDRLQIHCRQKCYNQLTVECGTLDFDYNQILQYLIHDKVNTIRLRNLGDMVRTSLADLTSFLRQCPNATKFACTFNRLSSSPSIKLLDDGLLHGDPTIREIKSELESWFRSRPDLVFFKLIYMKNGYLMHDQKLKLMERLLSRVWYLTDDYADRDEPLPGEHELFIQALESPFYFLPDRFFDCLI